MTCNASLWLTRGIVAAAVLALLGTATPAPAGGPGWSGATAISPVGNPDPTRDSQLNDVAVNASGMSVAAWDQYWYTNNGGSSIGAAVQPAGGKWGAPFTVSGTGGFALHPKVAVGADGTAAVAWTFQTPVTSPPAVAKIQVATRPAGATAWTVATLAQGPLGGVSVTSFVPVKIDASGNITAAWTLWNGSHNLIQAATMPKGGSWSTPVTLTAPGADGFSPSLSVNARGDSGVSYVVTPYPGYNMPNVAQYVFRSGPAGAWSAPVNVSPVVSPAIGYVQNPLAGIDGNGLATVIYLSSGVSGTRQLSAAAWTTPSPLIPAPNSVSSFLSPTLGVDANGNAVVAVSIFDATINVDRASVWVARGTAAGAWTAAVRITDPSAPVDAYATQAAVSPDGSLAMVGWVDHYHGTVQVSQWTGAAWGKAATIGKSTVPSSFQEVLSLAVGSGSVARAIWKSRSGTQIFAANYGG